MTLVRLKAFFDRLRRIRICCTKTERTISTIKQVRLDKRRSDPRLRNERLSDMCFIGIQDVVPKNNRTFCHQFRIHSIVLHI